MAESKRILVVDDEAAVLLILSAAISRMPEGIEVTTAKGGRQALQVLANDDFDLVITDLWMPGLDGIDLTEAIRREAPHVPVVWITARGCYQVHDDRRRLAVQRCLDKPLQLATIRQMVRDALRLGVPSPAAAPAPV